MSTRVDVEEIQTTKGEKLLAVVLAVFLLIGGVWTTPRSTTPFGRSSPPDFGYRGTPADQAAIKEEQARSGSCSSHNAPLPIRGRRSSFAARHTAPRSRHTGHEAAASDAHTTAHVHGSRALSVKPEPHRPSSPGPGRRRMQPRRRSSRYRGAGKTGASCCVRLPACVRPPEHRLRVLADGPATTKEARATTPSRWPSSGTGRSSPSRWRWTT